MVEAFGRSLWLCREGAGGEQEWSLGTSGGWLMLGGSVQEVGAEGREVSLQALL